MSIPTPTAILERRGAFAPHPERRRARSGEPKGKGDIGTPPDHFDELQQAVWYELIEQIPNGVVTGSDRAWLEVATRLMAEFRHSKKLSSSVIGQLAKYLGYLGLNPTDRVRLNVEKPKADDSNPLN